MSDHASWLRGQPRFLSSSRLLCNAVFVFCVAAVMSSVFAEGPASGSIEPFPPITTKLDGPSGMQLKREFEAIDLEIARLQKIGGKSVLQAQRLAGQVRPIRERLDQAVAPRGDTDATELHVVGLYEGDFPNGPRKFGRAVVSLEVTDRPVVLALSAYSPIRWEVRIAPGVKLQRILVSGYGEQVVDPAPAGVRIETRTHKGGQQGAFHVYDEKSPEYASAAHLLHNWAQHDIASFQGMYRYQNVPIVIGPSSDDWRIRRALSELEPIFQQAGAHERAIKRQSVPTLNFVGIRWKGGSITPMNGGGEFGRFTGDGPIEKSLQPLPRGTTRIAIDPRGPNYYGLSGKCLVKIDLKANVSTPIDVIGDLPELSWPCALAFDTKRNRVVMASLGGVGYLYAYHVDKDQWSLLSDMKNVDLTSLTYAADEDCFYGLGIHPLSGVCLIRFDSSGGSDRTTQLGAPLSDAVTFNRPFSMSQVIAAGGKLVVLTQRNEHEAGAPMTVTVMDPKTGKVLSSQPARHAVERQTLSNADFDKLWTACASADSKAAATAVQRLSAAGDSAVAFLRTRIPAPNHADSAVVRKLIDELDAKDWKTRDAAQAELFIIADQAEPELKAALASGPSLEARSRLQAIIADLARQRATGNEEFGEMVRDPTVRSRLRAIRILGEIGTPDAVEILNELASNSTDKFTAAQAASALRRI